MESLGQNATQGETTASNSLVNQTVPLKKRIRNLLAFGIVSLVIAVSGTFLYLCYVNAVNIVSPLSSPPNEAEFAAYSALPIEEVTFTSQDGLRLVGWYIPPAPDSDGASVLFLHGHGANRAQFLETAEFLAEDGYGMLMFDFRNHGASEGNRTTMGYFEVEDAIAAYEYLIAQPNVNPDRTAVFGLSMGGAVAIQTTARLPEVRAVVAITAYTDMQTLTQDHAEMMGLPRSPLAEIVLLMANGLSGGNLFEVSPIADMEAVGERAYFMAHGTADTTIPFYHAERLVEAAQGPTEFYIIEGAHHGNTISSDPDEYERRIRGFLGTHLRSEG